MQDRHRAEKYLFIICMNNSGSTLLERLLSSCRNAIGFLPRGGPNEQVNGQRFVKDLMPTPQTLGVRRVWSEQAAALEDESRYDWPKIKERWREQWSRNPKFATADPRVFLEKSPPNVYRAPMLQKNFSPAAFILVQRNPYAVAEGIRRRAQLPIDRCIAHWVRCTRKQIENERTLPRAITLRYEDLSECAEFCRQAIVDLVPELDDVDLAHAISAHSIEGQLRQPIVNYNQQQIAQLSADDIATINTQLEKAAEVMSHFGYEFIRS
jgi:hypothetical protein